jgi:hypothetical protein
MRVRYETRLPGCRRMQPELGLISNADIHIGIIPRLTFPARYSHHMSEMSRFNSSIMNTTILMWLLVG